MGDLQAAKISNQNVRSYNKTTAYMPNLPPVKMLKMQIRDLIRLYKMNFKLTDCETLD